MTSAQLLTQTVLAIYYVIADAVMVSQMIYYKVRDARRKYAVLPGESPPSHTVTEMRMDKMSEYPSRDDDTNRFNARLSTTSSSLNSFAGAAVLAAGSFSSTVDASDPCLTKEEKEIQAVGLAIAWTSAMLYLSSRVPQVYKNFKRKSTEGLSFAMFVLTVCGNLTYASSIFIAATSWADVMGSLPYLVGSLGTLCFDLTVWGQFFVYGSMTPKQVCGWGRRGRFFLIFLCCTVAVFLISIQLISISLFPSPSLFTATLRRGGHPTSPSVHSQIPHTLAKPLLREAGSAARARGTHPPPIGGGLSPAFVQ